jgi:hypothetical protein
VAEFSENMAEKVSNYAEVKFVFKAEEANKKTTTDADEQSVPTEDINTQL